MAPQWYLANISKHEISGPYGKWLDFNPNKWTKIVSSIDNWKEPISFTNSEGDKYAWINVKGWSVSLPTMQKYPWNEVFPYRKKDVDRKYWYRGFNETIDEKWSEKYMNFSSINNQNNCDDILCHFVINLIESPARLYDPSELENLFR